MTSNEKKKTNKTVCKSHTGFDIFYFQGNVHQGRSSSYNRSWI